MVIYLDESGDFRDSDHEPYFVVGSFTVGDPRRVEKEFRKFQATKFPRKLRRQAEVKFTQSSLDFPMRIRLLRQLAAMDIRIAYTYLKKANISEEYRRPGKPMRTGHLYTTIVAETVSLYLPVTDAEFRIFRDRRALKGISKEEFREVLHARLSLGLSKNTLFRVQDADSTAMVGIQVADWVSGALAAYHNGKRGGGEYFQAVKNNIVHAKELFSPSTSIDAS